MSPVLSPEIRRYLRNVRRRDYFMYFYKYSTERWLAKADPNLVLTAMYSTSGDLNEAYYSFAGQVYCEVEIFLRLKHTGLIELTLAGPSQAFDVSRGS